MFSTNRDDDEEEGEILEDGELPESDGEGGGGEEGDVVEIVEEGGSDGQQLYAVKVWTVILTYHG